MMAWACILLAFAGFGAIAASMDRHCEDLLRREPPARARRAWRGLGYAVLALALWPAIDAWGPSVGTVLWFGGLTMAALPLGLLLTYRPLLARRAACAALPLGLLVWRLAA
ncbi:DUF3325 domain-containing protein [Achromobacter aloeverae]|uniref:DUF3325 domain-containing protein n=1 Tax=Achromobacter aloeverae TaxID=1750518 RepID=A0A4Q1HGS9_9BURK|nr:DUF3325 domain-containing protein [Achromobacter aloeverae]RXN86587.1 DUF3325 domain-containing protein [Achromobacter aloeverae]